ncbi:MAG: hypothetical protein H7Z19_13190 [Chitinophagaceae bacterium]|nr:hypothetical protein [Rubrivivax sp.]
MNPRHRPLLRDAAPVALRRLGLALCCAAALCPAAWAQSSPYYIGVSQSFAHDSNLIRLRDGQAAPAGFSKSDTISSTGLVAGVDQTFGRQRLSGSGALRANRYSNNSDFDSQSYSANLDLAWQTIERLSGNLTLGADRALRADLRDRNDQFIATDNNETSRRFGATVSLGVAGPLGLEAGYSRSDVSYSAPEAAFNDYEQSSASAGIRWRLGGSSSVGLGVRQTRTDYPQLLVGLADPSDRRKRDDIDLNGTWVPSGASRFDLRLSRGKTKHDRFTQRDFTGNTGALAWSYTPGGRTRLNARLSRESGQDATRATTASSQITESLSLSADYEVSAKVMAMASLQNYRRTLDGSGQFQTSVRGRDRGTLWSLGARWQALRGLTLACQAGREERSTNSSPLLNDPFSASSYSCSGQFVLQ